MKITDEQCEELRQLCRQDHGRELSVDEAREMLSRMLFLVERFSAWLAKEK